MNDDKNKVRADAIELVKQGGDVEVLVRFMRAQGMNQPDSARLLADLTGMDLDTAQMAVLESSTWADQLERNIRIQDELAEALSELSEERQLNPTDTDDPNGYPPDNSGRR
jgi:ubiquinone biosynthesis protein UbiJ